MSRFCFNITDSQFYIAKISASAKTVQNLWSRNQWNTNDFSRRADTSKFSADRRSSNKSLSYRLNPD